mgnify:CR=1 FL=1
MINKDKAWKLEIKSCLITLDMSASLARKIELFSRFNLKKFEFSRLNYCLLVAKYHKSLL